MLKSKFIFVLTALLMGIVACTDGTNAERSAARTLENAGSVYKEYEPKVVGPGENVNSRPIPTPYGGNRY